MAVPRSVSHRIKAAPFLSSVLRRYPSPRSDFLSVFSLVEHRRSFADTLQSDRLRAVRFDKRT